jgi:hypothetical protein
MNMQTYANKEIETYQILEETIDGVNYLIAPVVMMVEGVHRGSHGPLFHPAIELSKSTAAWEGIPVVINHPQDVAGNYISVNQVQEQIVGNVCEPKMEGKKLKAKIRVNVDKTAVHSPTTIAALKANKVLEVSIGVFTDDVKEEGEWNGETYTARATNHKPDHLAILPSDQGACSVSDGCGIRVNKKGGNNMEVLEKIKQLVNNVDEELEEDFEIEEFDMDNFESDDEIEVNGGPGSGPRKGGGKKRKTVDNKNSWAVDKGSASLASSLKKGNMTKVRKDYSIEKVSPTKMKFTHRKTGSKHTVTSEPTGRASGGNHYTIIQTNNKEGMSNEDITMQNSLLVDFRSLQVNQLSYDDISRMMWDKLHAMKVEDSQGNELKECWPESIYDKYLIYRERTQVGKETIVKLYQQNYTITNDQIEFTDAPVEVVKELKYKVVQTNKEGGQKMADVKKPCPEGTICKESKVEALIANKLTTYTLADKEMLMGLDETIIDKMTPIEPEALIVNKEVQVPAVYKTVDEFLNAAPEEIRESLRSGLVLNAERKANLIQSILANSAKDSWTEDELKGMDTGMLEKLSKTYPAPVNYSANGQQAFSLQTNTAEMMFPAGVNVTPKKD